MNHTKIMGSVVVFSYRKINENQKIRKYIYISKNKFNEKNFDCKAENKIIDILKFPLKSKLYKNNIIRS